MFLFLFPISIDSCDLHAYVHTPDVLPCSPTRPYQYYVRTDVRTTCPYIHPSSHLIKLNRAKLSTTTYSLTPERTYYLLQIGLCL